MLKLLMSATACFGVCADGEKPDFLAPWCPEQKKGGVQGLFAVDCLVQLPDEAAVLDLLAGNAVDYIDLIADSTGATTNQATFTELIALGLIGSFFKNAYGSLTAGNVNTSIGECGKTVVDSTEWNFDVKSKAFDKSPNMYDMEQYNKYLKNYQKYDLFFVTCEDNNKAIHIRADEVEISTINYNIPESNKEVQEKQLGFTQTLAGACVPKYLPAPALATVNLF